MIQRIQTIYMAIAVIIAICCICFPVGVFVPDGMAETAVMSNIGIVSGINEHRIDFRVAGLFVIIIISVALVAVSIFKYRNRRLQAKLCTCAIALLLLWYVYYGAIAFLLAGDYDATFRVKANAALPLVSLILVWLARKAILADEALVKAADRIR